MYSKCGSIDSAFKFFSSLKTIELRTATAMLVAFNHHKKFKEALTLFEQCLTTLNCDEFLFSGAFTAASNIGDISEAKRLHKLMISRGVKLTADGLNNLISILLNNMMEMNW